MSQQIVSVLAPADVEAIGGIPPYAICGAYRDEGGQRRFVENRVFVDFMHQAIAAFAAQDRGFAEAAERQGEGYVYVIDLRTPEGPMGRVPPEDIVGGQRIDDGKIVEGAYSPNPRHRIMTGDGLFKLPAEMEAFLLAEIKRVALGSRVFG